MRTSIELSQYWVVLTKTHPITLTGERGTSWTNTNNNTYSTNAKEDWKQLQTRLGIGIYSKRFKIAHTDQLKALNNRAPSNPYARLKKWYKYDRNSKQQWRFDKSNEAHSKRLISSEKPKHYHTEDSKPRTLDRTPFSLPLALLSLNQTSMLILKPTLFAFRFSYLCISAFKRKRNRAYIRGDAKPKGGKKKGRTLKGR